MFKKIAGNDQGNDHDIGAAIIDLRFAAADNVAPGARSGGAKRIVFSFSSDAELLVDRSTSDDDGDKSLA